MNNDELDRLLRMAQVPDRPAEYWEEFPERVSRDLARPSCPARQLPVRSLSWAWALGLAAVCILVGLLVGHRFGREDLAESSGALLESEKLVREVLTLFPNRVRAIVKDASGFHLVLSEGADVPASTPLWMKICQGDHCTSVITFSGQELWVAEQAVTVLLDAKNNIIVIGDRFAWKSNEAEAGLPDLRIQARYLELASRWGER